MKIVFNTHGNEKQKEAAKYWIDDETDEVWYGGGKGGGKSYLGCSLIFGDALIYPGTHYFIARKKLNDLRKYTIPSINEVMNDMGVTKSHYKYNGQDNFFELYNESKVFLIDAKYLPSDPQYQRFGSMQMTRGMIEEGGEFEFDSYSNIAISIGRWKNEEYNLRGKLLGTMNPSKNFVKRMVYDPWKRNELEKRIKFVQALPSDNKKLSAGYIERLHNTLSKNERKRLLLGDWDYDDDPTSLIDYDNITAIFTNDHVRTGNKYITADIARMGSDKAIIMVWSGMRIIEVIVFDKSKTTEIQNAINGLRSKHGIPTMNCIADEDGVGGGVVDNCGIQGFLNGGRVIGDDNYMNLQTQCLYKLAESINNHELYFEADISEKHRHEIIEELEQVKSYNVDREGKMRALPKAKIKENIGRSPDWRDCFVGQTKVLTPKGYCRIDSINEGDLVVTPYGNRRVKKVIKRKSPDILYSVNGSLCTGNHRFFTKKGLISSDAMNMNDYIYTDNVINLIIWKIEKLFSIEDVNIGFQKRQNTTIMLTSVGTVKEKRKHFTEEYIWIIMGRFLKVSTYIILMEILTTMIQAIYRLLKDSNTNHTMLRKGGGIKSIAKMVWRILKPCKKKQKNGMDLKKDCVGIKSMQKELVLVNTRQKTENAKTAESFMRKKRRIVNTVQTAAVKNIITGQKNITKKGNVSGVGESFILERMKKSKPAHVHVHQNSNIHEYVYTLTVDKDNCYFANGMLVENCLLMREFFNLNQGSLVMRGYSYK